MGKNNTLVKSSIFCYITRFVFFFLRIIVNNFVEFYTFVFRMIKLRSL